MKKLQPYHILIICAALLLVVGVAIYGLRSSSMLKGGDPIEPPPDSGDDDLFELWFTEGALFDVNADRNATEIIFGSDTKKASLLNRERRLLWEKEFPTNPLQTSISACGGYLAVGTEGGELFFMCIDSQSSWQEKLGAPINLLRLSANGRWVLVGRGDPEKEKHCLELFNRAGEKQWGTATGPLENIWLVGEQPDQGKIIFTHRRGDRAITAALNLEGRELWKVEEASLVALSRTGDRLALVGDSGLLAAYNDRGELLWDNTLPSGFKVTSAVFNPETNNLLVYSSDSKTDQNLHYYNVEGKLIWKKKIADGALASFSADGARIMTCSWREFKEDFSQIVVYDGNGAELSHWEVGMRVEKMLVTGNRRYIILAGEDSYIDVVDLEKTPAHENVAETTAAPFYSPVTTGLKADQAAITLFFCNRSQFIPLTRLISRTKSPLEAAVEELIRGPSRESALSRVIPKETDIEVRFDSSSGALDLELSPETVDPDDIIQTPCAMDSLCYTLGCFSEVRKIYLNADQKPLALFDRGRELKQPLKPRRWETPLFIPLHVEGRYYLVPMEAEELKVKRRDLCSLLQAVAAQCRAFYFVPGDLAVTRTVEKDETVSIYLNRSFQMLFPEDGDEVEQLQAAMILDALFLTALENSKSSRFEICVEGEEWAPAQGYPSLCRCFYQAYYINPEF